jgi:type VI secretion system secreted protein VgrG
VDLPSIHAGDAVALLAQSDLIAAYTVAANQPCPDGNNLTGQDLGGLTLTPGTYCFATSAQLTGTLTLDALGDPDSEFIFQIGSTLTTASSSSVVFTGGRVFWQVGSSATLGSSTAFAGSILALRAITLGSGATIECGRALAANDAVTLISNEVSIDTGSPACATLNRAADAPSEAPEPGTVTLIGAGILACLVKAAKAAKQRDCVRRVLGGA